MLSTNDPCNCDTPLRSAFIKEFTAIVEEFAKKRGLEVNVATHNPFSIAFRGCLTGPDPSSLNSQLTEHIEMIALLSGDIKRAEIENMLSHQLTTRVRTDGIKSFDYSESVMNESFAKGQQEQDLCK